MEDWNTLVLCLPWCEHQHRFPFQHQAQFSKTIPSPLCPDLLMLCDLSAVFPRQYREVFSCTKSIGTVLFAWVKNTFDLSIQGTMALWTIYIYMYFFINQFHQQDQFPLCTIDILCLPLLIELTSSKLDKWEGVNPLENSILGNVYCFPLMYWLQLASKVHLHQQQEVRFTVVNLLLIKSLLLQSSTLPALVAMISTQRDRTSSLPLCVIPTQAVVGRSKEKKVCICEDHLPAFQLQLFLPFTIITNIPQLFWACHVPPSPCKGAEESLCFQVKTNQRNKKEKNVEVQETFRALQKD